MTYPAKTEPAAGGGIEVTDADPARPAYTLKTFKSGAGHLAHTRRVKQWVQKRFSLGEDETIMVNEVACELPGCPPIETVIAYWTTDGTRHHYKIFKPAADVVEDDLPPSWMKDALAVSDDFYCSCC